jgi:hypothetical protein
VVREWDGSSSKEDLGLVYSKTRMGQNTLGDEHGRSTTDE